MNGTIGELLINESIKIFKNVKNKLGVKQKIHVLDNKKFFVYDTIPSEIKHQIITNCYNVLYSNMNLFDLKYIGVSGISLEIKTNRSKNRYYKLGLALSDGSLLNDTHIIFSTSHPYTINSIVYGFGNVKIFFARYMVSFGTGKIIPIYNILIKDPELVRFIKSLYNEHNIVEVVNELKNNEIKLAQFLAGTIDGDGSLTPYDLRISVSKNGILYNILTRLFNGMHSYDAKKYLLRLKTSLIMQYYPNLLNYIKDQVLNPIKKEHLIKMAKRKHRAYIKLDLKISCKDVNMINDEILKIISKFKERRHGRYVYLYISSSNVDESFEQVYNCLNRLSKELLLPLNIAGFLRKGKREILIYNQSIVKFLKTIIECVKGH